MSETALDTLSIAHRLQKAGFDDRQAEAVTFAIWDGITGDLATREDIVHLDGKIDAMSATLRGEINTLRWMFGTLIAGVASLVLKAFFG